MDANRRPTQATVKGKKHPGLNDPTSESQEHLVQITGAAKEQYDKLNQKIYAVLDKKIEAWFKEFQQDIGGHQRHPWKWITGLILAVFLGLNGFLYYRQAQQIQQLNNLVEQLSPPTQVEPSGE